MRMATATRYRRNKASPSTALYPRRRPWSPGQASAPSSFATACASAWRIERNALRGKSASAATMIRLEAPSARYTATKVPGSRTWTTGAPEPLHDHGAEPHFAGTDAVDEGTGHGADGQGEDCDAPDQKSRDPEGDVPNLVQVYDEKRKCQPAADRGSEARREQDAQGPWETTRGHRSILALSSRFLNRLC